VAPLSGNAARSYRLARHAALGALWLTLAVSGVRADEVAVGGRLPPVTLADWQGRTLTLGTLRGRVVVIDFWASWCIPCREMLPQLDALAARHERAQLLVLAINIDSATAPAEQFAARYVPRPTMTLLRDAGGGTLARFGAAGMPALYVVDDRGVVRLVQSGYSADKLAAVQALVEELLRSAEPR